VTQAGELFACGWGAPARTAVRTVALLGDSHAAHWRPAVERMARHKNWRGVSMSRAGCPITAAVPKLQTRARSLDCMRWNRAVQRWLTAHPAITVVLVSQHRGRVVPRRGQSSGAALRQGYLRAWRRMLSHHVQHVIVIRDAPRDTPATLDCVSRALAAGEPAGPACAVPRRYALPPDPAAAAAAGPGTARIQVADLSDVFCDDRRCPPVIGGALVHRDTEHMNRLFAATLSPFLLATVDRLSATWRDPVRQSGDFRPQSSVGTLPGSSPLDPPRPATRASRSRPPRAPAAPGRPSRPIGAARRS
ncbi:MAG: acyltransferase, partial [Frankiales bacterium]|nr:acyltransferase [Frankiales bacterium]